MSETDYRHAGIHWPPIEVASLAEFRSDRLIYDVGMHTGDDTEKYLARGYTVIAVEANPELVSQAEARFARAISAGQLTIVGAAIAEHDGTVEIGISDSLTIWSSLDPAFIARNERAGVKYRYIEVPSMRFEQLISTYGMPHYLKIDIEGLDMLCVRGLRKFDQPPRYISLESHVSVNRAEADAVFDELAELWSLGYRRFRYVNQAVAEPPLPFDNEAGWRTGPTALKQAQLLRAHHNVVGLGGRWSSSRTAGIYKGLRRLLGRPVPWYDIQATYGSEGD